MIDCSPISTMLSSSTTTANRRLACGVPAATGDGAAATGDGAAATGDGAAAMERAGARGTVTVKVDPEPGRDCTATSCSRRAARRCTMDNPNPCPNPCPNPGPLPRPELPT